MTDIALVIFLGRAARRACRDYLAYVALIMLILLAIAWTIDLAGSFAGLRQDAARQGLAAWQLVLPYLTYRSADMVVRMLPMATFFGVYIAELLRRARLETVILKAAGLSPLRMLGPVLVFAVLAGTLQWRLEADLRPRAVAAQVTLGHGAYAARFRHGWLNEHAWFLSGNTAIRAQVLRDDPPAMRDILIFTGLDQPRLGEILAAERATPGATAGEWRLTGLSSFKGDDPTGLARPLPDRTITLDLVPAQLTHYGMAGFYLATPALKKIAAMRNAPTAPGADTAIWRRRIAWILPGIFAALAVLLAQTGFSGRQPRYGRMIGLAVAGYVSVVSLKAFRELGEIGAIPASAAVLFPIAVVAAITAALAWRQS